MKWHETSSACCYLLTAAQLVLYFSIASVQAGQAEVKLINKLLDGYNAYERPSEDDNSPLIVEFLVTLQQIMDVDEKNQVVHSNLWLTMKWNDYKLKWDPADYNNITTIRLPQKLLWKPDILMYNSADKLFDGSYPVNMVVSSDGSVEQLPPGIFVSSCSIDIRWFPFDTQNCPLKFGSWTYDGTKIDLRIQGGVTSGSIDAYRKSGEWDLIAFPVKRNVVYYDCCPDNPYIDLTFSMKIRRRKLYYLINIVLPCLMLAALTLLTFTIPCEAGEKISFGVTILLSLTVFLLMVAEALPATSDAVPIIAIYFSCVMLMNAASVGVTVLVLSYHHRSGTTHNMPKFVRLGVCVWLAKLLRIKRPGTDLSCNCKQRTSSVGHQNNIELHEYNNLASRSLLTNIKDEDDYSLPSTPHLNGRDFTKTKLRQLGTPPSPDLSTYSPSRSDLRDILSQLKTISNRVKKKEDEEQLIADWKFASRVLDRLFLYIFLLFILLSSCVIMMTVPDVFASSESIADAE